MFSTEAFITSLSIPSCCLWNCHISSGSDLVNRSLFLRFQFLSLNVLFLTLSVAWRLSFIARISVTQVETKCDGQFLWSYINPRNTMLVISRLILVISTSYANCYNMPSLSSFKTMVEKCCHYLPCFQVDWILYHNLLYVKLTALKWMYTKRFCITYKYVDLTFFFFFFFW